jgi:SpoVK/Ycf46/Vps4 family AAA+-type ATPase
MATVRKLAELFRALAVDDVSSATAVAKQICKAEEQNGHRSAARLLRGALGANGNGAQIEKPFRSAETSASSNLFTTAMVRLSTDTALTDVVLTSASRKELDGVVREWKHRGRLYDRGIAPRSKLLFHGPPGCGKSLTARALGRELGIPVYLVRFDGVIGAYLGQTAIHLRQIFHFAESNACILLLDELDALGKRRGNPLDVGELDRIVIALMQELEHSVPRGLIVATSNLAKNLDDALWRRFDLTLLFKAPSSTKLTSFAREIAERNGLKLPTSILRHAGKAKSFADAESIVMAEARRQALHNV